MKKKYDILSKKYGQPYNKQRISSIKFLGCDEKYLTQDLRSVKDNLVRAVHFLFK